MNDMANIEVFLHSTLNYLNGKERCLEQHPDTHELSAIRKSVNERLIETAKRTHFPLGCINNEDLGADDVIKRISEAIHDVKELIDTPPSVDFNKAPFKPIDVTKLSDIDAYEMSFRDIQKYLAQHHDCSEFQSTEAVGLDLDDGEWSRLQQCAVQDATRCYAYVAEERNDSIKDVADALIAFVQGIKDNGGFNNYPSIKKISTRDCLDDR